MPELHVLMAEAGGTRIAIEIPNLVEVVARPTLITLPGSPTWYSGYFIYRSIPLPVVDLGMKICGKPVGDKLLCNRVAIIKAGNGPEEFLVGLIVDRASAEKINCQKSSQKISSQGDIFLWGETYLKDNMIFHLLDIKKLLSPGDMKQLFPLIGN